MIIQKGGMKCCDYFKHEDRESVENNVFEWVNLQIKKII